MRLHPATQIISWCVLVTVMQFLPPVQLLVASSLVLLLANGFSRHKLMLLVRRTRWIMFSLWLIYAYSTPGVALFDSMFSPVVEGLQEGGLQLMRLLAALAALAILLDRLHRQHLIAGLYALFAPLQWLGLSRERLAVRLALTMHYAEVAMLHSTSWQDNLRSLTKDRDTVNTQEKTIVLPMFGYSRADGLLLASMTILLWQVF